MISWPQLQTITSIITWALAITVSAISFSYLRNETRREKEIAQINRLLDRLAISNQQHAERLVLLESNLNHAPSKDDLTKVLVRLEAMQTSLESLKQSIHELRYSFLPD